MSPWNIPGENWSEGEGEDDSEVGEENGAKGFMLLKLVEGCEVVKEGEAIVEFDCDAMNGGDDCGVVNGEDHCGVVNEDCDIEKGEDGGVVYGNCDVLDGIDGIGGVN